MEKTKRHEYIKLTFLLMGLAIAFIGLFVTTYYCYNNRFDDVQEIETMHYESMNYDLPYDTDNSIYTHNNGIIYHGVVENNVDYSQNSVYVSVHSFDFFGFNYHDLNYDRAVVRNDVAEWFGNYDEDERFYGFVTLLYEFELDDDGFANFYITDDTEQYYFFYFSNSLLTNNIINTTISNGECYCPYYENIAGDEIYYQLGNVNNGCSINVPYRYLYLTIAIDLWSDGNGGYDIFYDDTYFYLCSSSPYSTIDDFTYSYDVYFENLKYIDYIPLLPYKNQYILYDDLLSNYENAYQNGYDDGYLAGNNYGYSNGFQAGIDDGYEQGYAHGVSSALTESDMTSTYRYFVNSYVYVVDSSEFADFDYYMHNLGIYDRYEYNGVSTDDTIDLFSSYPLYTYDYETSRQYIIIPNIPIIANTTIDFNIPSAPYCLGFKLLFDDGSIENVPRNQFVNTLSRSWSKRIVAINFQLNFPINSDFTIKINTNSLDYDKGYAAGNKDGYSTGYDNGLNNGIAYGYGEGFKEGANNQNALANMVLTVAGVPFETFYQIWHFNVLGFNFADFIFGILSLLIVIFIIKKII